MKELIKELVALGFDSDYIVEESVSMKDMLYFFTDVFTFFREEHAIYLCVRAEGHDSKLYFSTPLRYSYTIYNHHIEEVELMNSYENALYKSTELGLKVFKSKI